MQDGGHWVYELKNNKTGETVWSHDKTWQGWKWTGKKGWIHV